MSKEEKISTLQAILLIVSCRLTTGYIYLPLPTPPANQDIWIVQILSAAYMFIICMPLLFLSNRFPDLTLIQYSERIMGKFAGKLAGILYIAFLSYINLLVLADATVFITSSIMPETPAYVIMLFALVTCVYTALKGAEAIGRTVEVLLPFVFITVILFFILSMKDMDFKVFLPVFADSGFQKINYGALNFSARFYEIIILCMLVPNLKKKSELNRIFSFSVLIFILFLTIITVSTLTVLGIEQAKHSNYPYFSFARLINVFDFIQKIEFLNVIGWFIVEFIKLSAYLYFISLGMKQIFNVKTNKVFIIPTAVLLFILASATKLKKSVVVYEAVSFKALPYISFVFIFIIPLILLIVYFFRRKSLTG